MLSDSFAVESLRSKTELNIIASVFRSQDKWSLELTLHRQWIRRTGLGATLISDSVFANVPDRNFGGEVVLITFAIFKLVDVDMAFANHGSTSSCIHVARGRGRGRGWRRIYRGLIGRVIHHFGLFVYHGLDRIISNDCVSKFLQVEDTSHPAWLVDSDTRVVVSIKCLTSLITDLSIGVHAHGGGCSENNCIELVWSDNGKQDPDRGPPGPRLATWVLLSVRRIKTNGEINAPPCTWGARSGKGYGCANILLAYSLDPIDGRVAPDATRQDD